MKHEGIVKSLVLDVSTLAEGVDSLQLQCLQDHDLPETSPLDAQLLTDFLSGGDAVAHKFCAYGNNGNSHWRESLFEALTARGWKSVKSNHRNYTPLKRCIEQLDEVGALSPNDELVLVLGKMTATVADLLAPFVKRGCNVKMFMFSCHKDAVRQLHLRGRILALDDKVVKFVRPDLQPQGIDAKARVAATADGVVSEDQTDFEADVESLGSDDTSDEFNDALSDEDGDFTGDEAEDRRPRSVIDASGDISSTLITPHDDELDGVSERYSPYETDNDADSDETEEEDWRSSGPRRGVADNGNTPQEQAAATENDRELDESTSFAPDSNETEGENWEESDSEDEAGSQLGEVLGCQESAPWVKYDEDEDEIRDGMALPVSNAKHIDRSTAPQQPGMNLPQPEIDSDKLADEKTETSSVQDKRTIDAEADDDDEAPICSLEAVAAKLADMLAALFGWK